MSKREDLKPSLETRKNTAMLGAALLVIGTSIGIDFDDALAENDVVTAERLSDSTQVKVSNPKEQMETEFTTAVQQKFNAVQDKLRSQQSKYRLTLPPTDLEATQGKGCKRGFCP